MRVKALGPWHLRRERKKLLQQIADLRAENTQLLITQARIEVERKDLAQWKALPERLERIRLIVEEICDHHRLDGVLRKELFEAVHMAWTARTLNTFFHVRVNENASRDGMLH